nr:MAG TPA: hypothetical protein [Bacteriophage sp.]
MKSSLSDASLAASFFNYVNLSAFYPIVLMLHICISSAYIFIPLGCRTLLEILYLFNLYALRWFTVPANLPRY